MLNDIRKLPKECAYCGSTQKLTKEHVIPRSFAGKGAKNWEPVIVWACSDCNGRKSKLDAFVGALFAIDFFGYEHDTAHKRVKGELLRGLRKGHMKEFMDFVRKMKPEVLTSHDGEILAQGMGGKIEKDPFTPWFVYVVKGLAMALSTKRFSEHAVYDVSRYHRDGFETIRQVIRDFQVPDPVTLGSHTKFTYKSVAGNATGFGIWFFQFYDGIVLSVAVTPPEVSEKLKQLRKAKSDRKAVSDHRLKSKPANPRRLQPGKELGITPRGENFADWYNDLVKRSDLAENSPTRGCMIIKPHGYAMWELMQRALDDMFKETGHVNAYFPLLIPKSFMAKEAEHIKGFAMECAVVTHHRLIATENGIEVDPEAKLEEEYVIRPTSETMIWHTYKNWIQSYRDLPLLINQWANVMRWELRPRLFLRTAEFLWQEGHTAHATYDEAEQEALTILHECYAKFAEEWMAVPVLKGLKSPNETFPGADHTYAIEALVQDMRAIQAGTSHHLGQNFAKAFDVKFQSKEGGLEYVYGTSWGVSTRLVGILLMAHSDDKGLVIPPKLAPIQVVIVPIGKDDSAWNQVIEEANDLAKDLRNYGWEGQKLRVKVDDRRSLSPGYRYSDWELKGACIRIELGTKDLDKRLAVVSRRDLGRDDKRSFRLDYTRPSFNQYLWEQTETMEAPLEQGAITKEIASWLTSMQQALFDKALKMREDNTHRVDTWDEFKACFEGKSGGGFVLAHWDGTTETELKISEQTKATIRVIPLEPLAPGDDKPGKCVLTGKPSKQRVVFAKAY